MLTFLAQAVTALTTVYAGLEAFLGSSKIISDLLGTTGLSALLSSLITAVKF